MDLKEIGIITRNWVDLAQDSENWRKWERKYLKYFEMWCWRTMEKIKWSEKITNEQVLDRVEEKRRKFINNILSRKANWTDHILRRNCLLHDAIEEHMTEVKGIGRSRIQLLEDLRTEEDIN